MNRPFSLFQTMTLAAVLLLGCSKVATAQPPSQPQQTVTPFEHSLGINLSTWLSHTQARSGADARDYFTKEDFDKLAEIGFDHIRLPIAEYMLYTSGLHRDADTFALIDQLVEWCEQAGIKLIINFHIPRAKKTDIWASQHERDKIVAIWGDLSKAFRKYPNELVAYEIFNEPNCPDDQMWNDFSSAIIREIRKEEPDRIIVLGPNKNNTISKLPALTTPESDRNLIVSVHFYDPALFTHYGVGKLNGLKIKLNYPGQIITQDVDATLTEEQRERLKPYRGNFTRETLKKRLSPVVEFSERTGLRVRCGEFGFNDRYSKATGDTAIQPLWTADMTAVFRELGIPHSFWGYKATFGLFNDDGTVKDERIIKALTE